MLLGWQLSSHYFWGIYCVFKLWNVIFFQSLLKLISFYFQTIKIECEVRKNEHFLRLLFAFSQGTMIAKATHYICAVYEGAIAKRTAHDWYAKLKNGNFDLKDVPCSCSPFEFDEEQLNHHLQKTFSSHDRGTDRENEMPPHCYREAFSLNGKHSEVWSMVSACFK